MKWTEHYIKDGWNKAVNFGDCIVILGYIWFGLITNYI